MEKDIIVALGSNSKKAAPLGSQANLELHSEQLKTDVKWLAKDDISLSTDSMFNLHDEEVK